MSLLLSPILLGLSLLACESESGLGRDRDTGTPPPPERESIAASVSGVEAPAPAPPPPEPAQTEASVQTIGKAAFEALRSSDVDAYLQLTPLGNAQLERVCPRLLRNAGMEGRQEVTARFAHCQRSLAWAAVQEASVAGGEPTGKAAPGCEDGLQELEPIRMRVRTNTGIVAVDLFAPVAAHGKALGISGAIKCSPLP